MKSLFENPCRAVKVYYPIGQINAFSKHQPFNEIRIENSDYRLDSPVFMANLEGVSCGKTGPFGGQKQAKNTVFHHFSQIEMPRMKGI